MSGNRRRDLLVLANSDNEVKEIKRRIKGLVWGNLRIQE